MYFDASQISQLIERAPLMQLLNTRALDRLLNQAIRDGSELSKVLSNYPQIWYEPLDTIYKLLEFQGIRDDKVVSDLCDPLFGWRGIVVAAWISCLSPMGEFQTTLNSVRSRVPKNQWLIDIAIAEIRGADLPIHAQLQASLRLLRGMLSHLPSPQIQLRVAMEAGQYEQARRDLVDVYKSRGISEALAFSKSRGLVVDPITFKFPD
jgi:hypothetical protein